MVDAALPVEELVRHHLLAIVARFWPGGVLSSRTAFAGSCPPAAISPCARVLAVPSDAVPIAARLSGNPLDASRIDVFADLVSTQKPGHEGG